MGGSAGRIELTRTAGVAALALAAACASEPEMDWNPGVVRAVAERSAALLEGHPMIVWRRVLIEVPHGPGPALPWAAHQALITAGFIVVDSAVIRPDTGTLGFESIRKAGDEWRVVTALISGYGSHERGMDHYEWVLRCTPECAITDSAFLGSETVGAGR